VRCETCGAPAVLLGNACVFCRTPVADSHAPAELLDYLAARLPAAQVKRFGLRRRGPVRELTVAVGSDVFTAKVARGRLELTPDLARPTGSTGSWRRFRPRLPATHASELASAGPAGSSA